jgi:hypothetical protein
MPMSGKSILRVASAAAACVSLVVAAAAAQPADKRTYFTFSAPVAVPGVTLPPGQYMFRIIDTTSRNVVQVLSKDGMKHYTLFMALPAERGDIPDEPEIRFLETAAGMPSAVKTWWYPGTRSGWEFVYPRRQARLLTRGRPQPILTTETETTTPAETRAAEVARITPEGQPVPDIDPDSPLPVDRTLRGELAPPSVPVVTPEEAFAALPATASAAPLLAFAGAVLLAGVAALRLWRLVRG